MPTSIADILTSTTWPGALAIGLAYAATALGVFITFRILAFPDLTIDGSFPLGAAVMAVLIIRFGWSHWATLPVAACAGALAGMATGFLAARLRINGLLASILVALALYSINLRVLGQGNEQGIPTANLPLLSGPEVTDGTSEMLESALKDTCLAPDQCFDGAAIERYAAILVFGLVALGLIALLYWFLRTELGLALRATGDNEQMVRAQGVNPTVMRVLGLAVSNALIALSGALFARYNGFADVTLGRGLIAIGLASVIIGEVLLAPQTLRRALFGVVLGSVGYHVLRTLALNTTSSTGVKEGDLQLLTAIIVVIALAAPHIRRYLLPARTT